LCNDILNFPTPRGQEPLLVLGVGDSQTCGLKDPPIGDTVLDRFCHCLEVAGVATKQLNLGESGATSREGVRMLQSWQEPADVVFINFGMVDSSITSLPNVYLSTEPDHFIRGLARKSLHLLKHQISATHLQRIMPTGAVVPMAEYRQNVEQMIAVARRRNPAVWVVLWGSPCVLEDDQHNEQLLRYNELLHEIALGTESYYFPTQPVVESLGNVAYQDNQHLSGAATHAIAEIIATTYLSSSIKAAA